MTRDLSRFITRQEECSVRNVPSSAPFNIVSSLLRSKNQYPGLTSSPSIPARASASLSPPNRYRDTYPQSTLQAVD